MRLTSSRFSVIFFAECFNSSMNMACRLCPVGFYEAINSQSIFVWNKGNHAYWCNYIYISLFWNSAISRRIIKLQTNSACISGCSLFKWHSLTYVLKLLSLNERTLSAKPERQKKKKRKGLTSLHTISVTILMFNVFQCIHV